MAILDAIVKPEIRAEDGGVQNSESGEKGKLSARGAGHAHSVGS